MKLSIVIPVYNEEKILSTLKARLENVAKSFNFEYEIVFVNDGSRDQSVEFLKNWISSDPHVVLIELSRNFGHQQAITAGLEQSSGDAVIILDADLQDPPELIPQLVKEWEKGYKVVLAERTIRKEGFIRGVLFSLFYKLFVFISDLPIIVNSGVFGLMDRTVVDQLLNLRERNRYLPGLRSWLGFETTSIRYERQERIDGKPKVSLKKLFRYGFDAIFSFSYKPIRVCFFLGIVISSLSFLYATILIVRRLLNIDVVPGFTTPTVAIFFIGGILLVSMGIIGEYLARIYDEVKRRPLYIISRRTTNQKGKGLSVEKIAPTRLPS